jgi:hypothetical protein
MGAMRRMEKLDAQLLYLQAQQEVAHCLAPLWEDVEPSWVHKAHEAPPVTSTTAIAPGAAMMPDKEHTLPVASFRADYHSFAAIEVADMGSPKKSISAAEFTAGSASTSSLGTEYNIAVAPAADTISNAAKNNFQQVLPMRAHEKSVLSVGLDWQSWSLNTSCTCANSFESMDWRLQWSASCLQTLVGSHSNCLTETPQQRDDAAQCSDVLWRLPWSHSPPLESTTSCGSIDTSQAAPQSSQPLARVVMSLTRVETLSLEVHPPRIRPHEDTPFDMKNAAALLTSSNATWQLSWANVFEMARKVDAQQAATLWQLPWSQESTSEVRDLVQIGDSSLLPTLEDFTHQRADWQLVWLKSRTS